MLVAGRKILFGLRCEEPNLAGMKLSVGADGESRLWTDDGLELFIDPSGGGKRYFHVMANAAGFVFATDRNAPGRPFP